MDLTGGTDLTDVAGMAGSLMWGLLVLFLVVEGFEGGIYDAFGALGDVAVSGPIQGPRCVVFLPPRHKYLRHLRRGVTSGQGRWPCACLRPAQTHLITVACHDAIIVLGWGKWGKVGTGKWEVWIILLSLR